ncbi:Conserved hypothetical protein [Prochlorococcus marinus str. MIT 9515]|uniref:Uncharacterized protein n=2 Tax=Prochlorococcus marinus TaxID=1219 RepID=A2BW52_PROM5|nr:Conserved hypothetical protein [Prochlorococcus marinus str. MIT 9515]
MISLISKLKMEDSKITYKANIINETSISSFKVICSKCAGSGNFKTSENVRRTCLECYGKGFINI